MADFQKVTRSDPFEVPQSVVPLGLKYQWQAKTVCDEPHEQYGKMLDAGWLPVPPQWRADKGPVEQGGQVLLCHAHARDEEADRVAGAQKNVEDWMRRNSAGISGGVRITTQDSRGESPAELRIGVRRFAEQIAPRSVDWRLPAQGGIAQSYSAEKNPLKPHRIPRHPAFAWLFNLISKDQIP